MAAEAKARAASPESGNGEGKPGKRNVCAVVLALAALASALLFTTLLACGVGSYPTTPGQTLRALAQAAGVSLGAPVDADLAAVVVDIRLARVLLAGMTGAALSVAGAAFQGVLRNPLADAFTLGVSGGAAFAASMGLISGVA